MMCIACIGLWGGGIASLIVMFKSTDKKSAEIMKEIEDAESETCAE